MARKTSTTRMMRASARPPKKPASRPRVTPISADSVTAEMIGAEGVLAQPSLLPHRRPQALHQHLPRGIPRRELRREHRRPADHEQHAEAEHRAEADMPARPG